MEKYIHDYFSSGSPLITAVALFIFSILLAKIADIFSVRILRKVTKYTKSELDDRILELLHRPVFLTIICIGAIHSINILNASEAVVFSLRGTLLSLVTLMWAIFVMRASSLMIDKSFQTIADITGLSNEVSPLIGNIWKVIIIIGSIMIVLGIWNVDITPLLASAGIAGVAVALAAKDTLANFFGGISIFIDKPYKIGDYIVLDRGERGEVTTIGIRSTRIKTRDDILITIPNSVIANTKIINESAPVPNFRMRVPVTVAYGSDIESVENILIDIAHNNDSVISNPEPRVRFRAFGESSLNFELLCWAKDPSVRGKAIHEMNKEIYKIFDRENITIPFPHRTVYVREEKDWQKR